jgi:hypothetical protein
VKLVKVRLSGDTAALGVALALLVSAVQGGGAEIAEQSGLYPNRRDPGCRVYLTLMVPDTTGTGQHAAARRRAIRRDGAA